MKTTLRKVLGWGSVLALVAGFSSTGIAGPGPQYWQQQEKIRAENAAKAQAAVPAAKPADTAAMACASCKTEKVQEISPGFKGTPRWTDIGTKHSCNACGGAIATVRGKTTDNMKGNCPICAKAKVAAACCNTTT